MGMLRPQPKPKRVYPNSDRFEENGRIAAILLVIAAATVAISVIRSLPF